MTRRRRQWKPKRSGWITTLGLANAVALAVVGTAGLGLPDVAIRWVALAGAVALIVKGTLEEGARQEALKTPPPRGEGE